MIPLAFIPHLGTQELVIILIIALLIFGRRLPEVGKSLGKGIVEFKRGVKGIDDEIEAESDKPGKREPRSEQTPPNVPPASLPDAAPPADSTLPSSGSTGAVPHEAPHAPKAQQS